MENSYELIAKFEYNKKKLLIIKVNNNTVIYTILDGNKLSFKISDEEMYIFNLVYASLKVDKKSSINLGLRIFDNKKFEIFYDPNKYLHFWYEIKNNKRFEASEEDNCKLNYIYNNMPTILYKSNNENKQENNNKKTESKKFIKRFIKKIAVLVVATTSLTGLLGTVVANSKNVIINDYSVSVEVFPEEYNFDKIKAAIDNNENLTNSEKNFLHKLKFVFDENNQYMNIGLIIDRLSDLKIKYTKDAKPSNPSISGEYNTLSNEITIYKANQFEDCILNVLTHEIMHVFQANGGYIRFTSELSNELTAREVLRRMDEMGLLKDVTAIYQYETDGYLKGYGNGYGECMKVEYLLAELMTKEEMQAYQFSLQEEIIENALYKIDQKESFSYSNYDEDAIQARERIYTLMDKIDELRQYDEDGNLIITYDDDKFKDIYNQIGYYYSKLNKEPIESSLKANINQFDFEYKPSYKSENPINLATEKTLLDEEVNPRIL